MKLIQLKQKDLKWVREKLLESQGWTCAICGCDLKEEYKINPRSIHTDHQHFGDKRVRGVLCRSCNVCEGKLWNSYQRSTKKELRSDEGYMNMIRGLHFYYDNHLTEFIHPSAIKKKRKPKKVPKKRTNTK